MARPPLALDADCRAQCVSCHFWNNLRDLGHVEPGVCTYCDELKELRAALEELRGMIDWSRPMDEDIVGAYRGLAEALVLTVVAMRAGRL